MVAQWLANKAPSSVRYVKVIFSVTGHSFISPDRVFGRLEKKRKSKKKLSDQKTILAYIEKLSGYIS